MGSSTAGNTWVSRIRRQAFVNVLAQEHDNGEYADVRVVQTRVKDGDDARNSAGAVLGDCAVMAVVGMAAIPVFAGMVSLRCWWRSAS
jgi:ATP-binding cassette subfamily B (MDR/TAP) protein 1